MSFHTKKFPDKSLLQFRGLGGRRASNWRFSLYKETHQFLQKRLCFLTFNNIKIWKMYCHEIPENPTITYIKDQAYEILATI